MQLKLYSIGDLHGMLPEDTKKDVTPGDLGKLVEQHGTYRQLGKKARVMTADDVRRFFARISAVKTVQAIEPAPGEVGYITWIGDPAGSSQKHMVLVDWVERGGEFDLSDTVRNFCDSTAKIIATRDMSYGDFLKWREAHRKPDHWEHGKWFYRTDKVMKLAQSEEDIDGV